MCVWSPIVCKICCNLWPMTVKVKFNGISGDWWFIWFLYVFNVNHEMSLFIIRRCRAVGTCRERESITVYCLCRLPYSAINEFLRPGQVVLQRKPCGLHVSLRCWGCPLLGPSHHVFYKKDMKRHYPCGFFKRRCPGYQSGLVGIHLNQIRVFYTPRGGAAQQ